MIIILAQPQASHAQSGSLTHIVREGETLTSIANHYRVSVYALIAANHLDNADALYVGERLIIPVDVPQGAPQTGQSAPGTYTVRPGDTLSGIADQLGVSVDQLAAANKIADPSLVQVGRVLKVPGDSSGDSSNDPASTSSLPPLPDGQQTVAPAASGPTINFQISGGQLVNLTLQAVSSGKQSLPLSCEAKIAGQIAMMYGLNFDESSFQIHL